MSSNPVKSTLKPVEQVLNTTELLEHIFSFLSMPQVLGKSRVSRNWKAVIDDSPALQKKLFLRHHDGQAEVVSVDHWFYKPPRQYPNLTRVQSRLLYQLNDDGAPVYTTPIELNPLVDRENQGDLNFSHEMRKICPKPFDPSLSGLALVLGRYSRAYVRRCFGNSPQTPQANPSWRRMFLTTPPITDIVIAIQTSVGGVSIAGPVRFKIHAEGGITLGLFSDRIEELLRNIFIKDARHEFERRDDGPLQEKDFVRGWGDKEHAMFLVQPTRDATGLQSQ